ncbi:MAG TPA: DUF1223 domain-containing protein [Terriglobales bacterium]|nr:DUF1223 domain-containing protein [Terriglobales bacterium]
MKIEMKTSTAWFCMVACLCCPAFGVAADASAAANPVPIFVELFTAEGCSSCPPADQLLQKLDESQPTPGAQLIVLSEHVTYWDQLGWKDPNSSSYVTDRQAAYAARFGLKSPYTPEMVVDGTTEFVGNDARLAGQAIEKALHDEKVQVRLSSIALDSPGKLRAQVAVEALAKNPGADVYLVVALNRADSQVERGENKGRHLQHVAVAQSITRVGSVDQTHNFAKAVEVRLDRHVDPSNLRVIAFVQRHGSDPVMGATMSRVPGASVQSAAR